MASKPCIDAERDKRTCLKHLESNITNRASKAYLLLEEIRNLGCDLPSDFISCRPCPTDIGGGFGVDVVAAAANAKGGKAKPLSSSSSPSAIVDANRTFKAQVVMCENKAANYDAKVFESTLIHELVHAFDVCRAKIDYKKCDQVACTEIRASSLSGECNMLAEVNRLVLTGKAGQLAFLGGHQACVKRRAALSVGMVPQCKEQAGEAVERVFQRCFGDRCPFDNPLE